MSASGEIRIFLIADIRGYTKFTHDRGDEAGARLASRFADLAAEGIEHHEGSVVELRGDEVLAVFTSPRQSLRAAVELQTRFVEETAADPSLPLRVGIGLDAGEAVEVGNGYRGAPLNIASRLCALATPGEVLATQGVVDLARHIEGLRLYEQGPTRLKGLDRPVTIVKVVAETANPYKGLRAFDEADAPDFFGREALTEQLLDRLAEKIPSARLLAVVGPSGSGKSSVVRAGLVPALRAGALPGWTRARVAVMIPGLHPMKELAAALRRVPGADQDDLEDLSLDPADLGRVVERALPPRSKLVLVIDQFEELFTLVEDEELRTSFLEALYEMVVQPKGRLAVVITLRADFYDRPLLYKEFGGLVGTRTHGVTALSPHELERAVTGPAERAGVALEPGLVSQIVADVSSEPGALPLLQYALTELFEHRSGNNMTLEAYRTVGGVSGALIRRAESLYGELEPTDRDAARQLFLRLATSVNEVDVTRRRVARAEILSVVGDATAMETALDAFGAGRLLSFDRDPFTGTPTVEVAHEALLSEWSRLRGWLEAAREDLRAERRLAAAAREWLDAGRDDSFLVTGSRLERFEGWRESSGLAVTPEQGDFLAASRASWERVQAEDEARQARERALERRTLRRTRALVAVLGVAALVAAGLTVLAFNQRARAQREARTAVARELAAASVANLETDPERSILLAVQAIEETRSADGTVLPEAKEALHQAVVASRIELSVPGVGGAVDWSPRGVFVTEGPEESGVIDIRDVSTGKRVRSFRGHDIDINDVAFDPTGSMLATVGDDGKLKLWDPKTGRSLRSWSGTGAVWGPSFDATGSLLAATWREEGIVRVVDPTNGQVVNTLSMKGAFDTAFSPDGERLAVTSNDLLEVAVFDLDTGRRELRLPSDQFPVDRVAWSPDGRFIATAGDGQIGRVWDAATGRLRFTLSAHAGPVYTVDWSPDSSRLVTGGLDGIAIVWDITKDDAREFLRISAQEIRSGALAAFSPSGDRVITGAYDISATKIWDISLSGDAEWANLPVATPPKVEFSQDARRLVATSATDSVSIWELATGRKVRSIPPPGEAEGSDFYRFDVSPDGKLIAMAGLDGIARVRNVSTGEERFTVRHEGGGSSNRLSVGIGPSVAWSGDGRYLVTSDPAGTTKIVDRSGRLIGVLREVDGFLPSDADISADGRKVVTTASPERTSPGDAVKVWDRDTGKVVTSIQTDAHEVAFDPSGTRIATGDERGLTQIWDADTGENLQKLSGHAGPILDIVFNPDGSTVATASFDGTIRLFDPLSGLQGLLLRAHRVGVFGLDFSPDGTKLASAGLDGVARVWALDIDHLLEIARTEVTRSLTDEECRQYLHLDDCPTSLSA
ncbi:MAG TPA: AAA family ATPase [Actinomycetota bacterium]|nr:AAA family ATPase [Actinomycetota bacterium]